MFLRLLSEENAPSTYIKPLSEAKSDNMEVRATRSDGLFAMCLKRAATWHHSGQKKTAADENDDV
jgi:hypothetical protein